MKWDECDDVSVLSPRALQLHVDDPVAAIEDDVECSISSRSESNTTDDEVESELSGEIAEENDEISLLRPHNTDWRLTGGIQVDQFQGPKTILSFTWDFGHPVAQRTSLDYFCAMFPMLQATEWREKTNENLNEMKRKSLSESEFFRLWGLIVAISIGSEQNRRRYWMEELDSDSGWIFQAPAFGSRFGMGVHRFEDILRCLSFGDEDPTDRWSPIRPFMTAINARCKQVIDPSYLVVEDELMSSWISRKQDRTIDGIPHLTKIIRKPKGVGTEVKCLADGIVGIILRLELCEGKEAESKKKWSHLPAGTAHSLRVTEPWHGTGRILVADSAFSSVTTAIECKKCGLFFTGILKTASREFPKEYLSDSSKYNSKGNHVCLSTIMDNCSLIAIGWRDKTIKTFISTCGTTLPGQPHQKHRYTKDGELTTSEVQCPQMVSQYFSAACKIDVHNHLRQGLLAIEEKHG